MGCRRERPSGAPPAGVLALHCPLSPPLTAALVLPLPRRGSDEVAAERLLYTRMLTPPPQDSAHRAVLHRLQGTLPFTQCLLQLPVGAGAHPSSAGEGKAHQASRPPTPSGGPLPPPGCAPISPEPEDVNHTGEVPCARLEVSRLGPFRAQPAVGMSAQGQGAGPC